MAFFSRLQEGNPRSITAMLLAVMLFSVMDTLIKALSAHYSPLQIAAMRGALTLPLIAIWIQWRGSWAAVWQARWPPHLLRGGLVIAMLVLFTYGVRGLPLTNAYTLMFFAPLLITVLGGACRVRTGGSWAGLAASGFLAQLALTEAFRHG